MNLIFIIIKGRGGVFPEKVTQTPQGKLPGNCNKEQVVMY